MICRLSSVYTMNIGTFMSVQPHSPASLPLTAIDLFCGAGGFSLAAQNTGIKILAALELSRLACATYTANFITDTSSPPVLLEQDILTVSPKNFSQHIRVPPHSLDILMGGPPCQGYSSHRLGDSCKNDPRNKLLIRYFDFVKYLDPQAFIVENVPGMLWERHKEYVKKFYVLAESAGYHVTHPLILNAKDYGVPQNRRRVFIFGTKHPIPAGMWPPPPTHFSPDSPQVLQQQQPAWVNAIHVFNEPLAVHDPNTIHMQHCQELIDVFKSTPKNGGSRAQSNRVLPCHKKHHGHKDVYGRIDPARPGPTMTTACTNPSKGRFLHPTENHGITVRHAARFQTFPENFTFQGGIIETSRQVGNAVPIKLGQAVLQQIVKILRMQ